MLTYPIDQLPPAEIQRHETRPVILIGDRGLIQTMRPKLITYRRQICYCDARTLPRRYGVRYVEVDAA